MMRFGVLYAAALLATQSYRNLNVVQHSGDLQCSIAYPSSIEGSSMTTGSLGSLYLASTGPLFWYAKLARSAIVGIFTTTHSNGLFMCSYSQLQIPIESKLHTIPLTGEQFGSKALLLLIKSLHSDIGRTHDLGFRA